MRLLRSIIRTLVRPADTAGTTTHLRDLKLVHNGWKGIRPDCDYLSFDSKWEANVYRFLKSRPAIIEVIRGSYDTLYFPFAFDQTPRGYVPDFKVFTREGTYLLEVKGCTDIYSINEKDLRKVRLLRKYYPRDYGTGVLFITQREYSLIQKHYAHKIKNWEW